MLQVERLSVRYGNHTVVDDVSFEVRPGEWWVIAGPNGAGKTSLISAVTCCTAFTGSVLVEGKDVSGYKAGELARRIGVLSQTSPAMYDFTVGEVVEMGRYAHRAGFLRSRDPEGPEKIREALSLTEMESLRDRSMLSVSGGESQRAFLAQVLAQDPKLLILDEPANHLDLPFQRRFLDMVRQWLAGPGRAVITVLHDLTLAKRYATHALLMCEGRAAACGPAADVLTPEKLSRVYRMDVYAWMRESLALWQDA